MLEVCVSQLLLSAWSTNPTTGIYLRAMRGIQTRWFEFFQLALLVYENRRNTRFHAEIYCFTASTSISARWF